MFCKEAGNFLFVWERYAAVGAAAPAWRQLLRQGAGQEGGGAGQGAGRPARSLGVRHMIQGDRDLVGHLEGSSNARPEPYVTRLKYVLWLLI